MSRSFRRPYMVEATYRLYSPMGQSDPVKRTFSVLDDAEDCAHLLREAGGDVTIFIRDPANGEWEECSGVPH